MHTSLSPICLKTPVLVAGLALIHSFTYLVAIVQYKSNTGYYPAQLSEANQWIVESLESHTGFSNYLFMLACTGLTLLLIYAILIRMIAEYGTAKVNPHDYILPILFFIPLALELCHWLKPAIIPKYLVLCVLTASIAYSLAVTACDTWKRRNKHFTGSLAISDAALPIFYTIAATMMLAALTNIQNVAVFSVSLAKIHGILSAFSYVLFFAFIYTLRHSAWVSWLCLVLSAVCIVFFFSTEQNRHSPTITPHFLYEFLGCALLYIAFIVQTTRDKID